MRPVTKWLREFKKECPKNSGSYEKALSYSKEKNLKVVVYKSHDLADPLYAVAPKDNPEFWLNTFERIKNAKAFCKEMGWIIVE
jgi:hypothetical protein